MAGRSGLLECEKNVLRRVFRITAGFGMLAAGLLLSLPGVPGPGLLVALGGLVLLSRDFHWARRAVVWLKKRAAQARRKVREGRQRSRV